MFHPTGDVLANAFAASQVAAKNREQLIALQRTLAAPAAGNLRTIEMLRRALVSNPGLTQAQQNAELIRKVARVPLEQHQRSMKELRSALTAKSVLAENMRTIEALRKTRTFPTPLQGAAAEAARKALTQRNVTLTRALRDTSSTRVRPRPSRAERVKAPAIHAPSSQPYRPWWSAAIQLRTRTLSLIFTFDTTLSRRWDGAWERVVRGGPHSASQAAHSTVEFVDWVFRAAAPDAAVLKWHSENKRPAGEIREGRPTRPARMRYTLRDRDPDGEAAKTYVRLTTDLLNLLQSIKHTADGDRRTVAASIMALESSLVFFFAP